MLVLLLVLVLLRLLQLGKGYGEAYASTLTRTHTLPLLLLLPLYPSDDFQLTIVRACFLVIDPGRLVLVLIVVRGRPFHYLELQHCHHPSSWQYHKCCVFGRFTLSPISHTCIPTLPLQHAV